MKQIFFPLFFCCYLSQSYRVPPKDIHPTSPFVRRSLPDQMWCQDNMIASASANKFFRVLMSDKKIDKMAKFSHLLSLWAMLDLGGFYSTWIGFFSWLPEYVTHVATRNNLKSASTHPRLEAVVIISLWFSAACTSALLDECRKWKRFVLCLSSKFSPPQMSKPES